MSTPKNPDEILQEEFLKERAEVLGRAGTRVSEALNALQCIEEGIAFAQGCYERLGSDPAGNGLDDGDVRRRRIQLRREIETGIRKFNQAREEAKLRYYYLIVTREALGLRRHHWVEAAYRIPPKKAAIRDD